MNYDFTLSRFDLNVFINSDLKIFEVSLVAKQLKLDVM